MKMDCRQIEELMMDYLYQELDADQMTAYRAHLPTCGACAAMLAGYERTRQAVRALPELEPPASITSRLLAEAARRPAVAAVGGVAATAPVEGKSAWAWLTGWMQPVFAHPGFAAAASVVIVAGIAGILTLRGKMDLTAAPQAAAPLTEKAPAPVPEAPADSRRDEVAAAAAPAPTAAPGVGAYAVNPEPSLQPREAEKKAVGTVHLAKRPQSGELDLEDGFAAKDKASGPRGSAAAPRAAAPKADAEAPADEARGRVLVEQDQKPAANMAAAKPSAPAPRPAKQARRESSLDDASGVEGGVVGGEMAGSVAAAPSAAPPPPPAAPAPVTSGAGGGATTKGKSADSPQLAEAKKLHGQARSKANTGDCPEALRLRDRIYRVDPAYFERSVKNDADLGKCTVARKKAAPAAAEKSAPAEDAAPSRPASAH